MSNSIKHRLTGITLVVAVSLTLAACNMPGGTPGITPTPEAASSTPVPISPTTQAIAMPTHPAGEVQHIIQQTRANLAAVNIQSYVVTETNSARTIVQAHFGMGISPVATGDEQLHTTTTIWYQHPNRWRIETSKTSYADQGEPGTWPPVEVSDGTNLWSYDPQNKIANTHPLTALGINEIGSSDIVSHTAQMLDALDSNCNTPPTYEGTDTVLGRSTYMIDLGGSRCPDMSLPDFSGKNTLWFDQQTGLLLKDVSYYVPDQKPLSTWQVADLRLNVVIDPSTFSFSPLAGVAVLDNYNFHQPYPTPVAGRYSPDAPITVAEARQQLNFPIFVPTYVPAGLTAEPPMLNSEGPDIQSLQILYHDRKGQDILEVMNSTPDKLGNLAAQSSQTATLANGITAYYGYGATLVWQQDGTYIAIGNPSAGLRCSEFSKDDLVKIANSMSSTADLAKVEAQPTAPPTQLGLIRQGACQPVFIPTYVPAGVTAEQPQPGSSMGGLSGVVINYHTSDGAIAFSVFSGSPPVGDYPNPFAMNVETVTLPNGIAASFFIRPVECGYGQTSLSWSQDGAYITIERPPPDNKAAHFQLTKDEIIKIAASMSSSAELGKTEYPTVRPTQLPQPEGTADTCPPLP